MKKSALWGLSLLLLLSVACTATPPTAPIPDGPTVKTDWSALTDYVPKEAIYTRRYPAFTDTLIPAEDYGPLIPFLGDRLGGLSGEGDLLGFVTMEGEIVTDPVFSGVWQGVDRNGLVLLPYMMIQRSSLSLSEQEWPDEGLWAMCARDGSWCTEFRYHLDTELLVWGNGRVSANGDENGIFAMDDTALVYLDGSSGRELFREEMGQEYWNLMLCHWIDGMVYYKQDSAYLAVDPATGQKVTVSDEEVTALLAPRQLREDEISNLGNWVCDKVTGEKYLYIHDGENRGIYDQFGGLVTTLPPQRIGGTDLRLTGGMLQTTASWGSGLQKLDGSWVFRYPLPIGEWD